MGIDDLATRMKRVPFFQAFSGDQARLIAFGASTQTLRPGEFLFRAGDPADGAYLVVSGVVELFDDLGEAGVPSENMRARDIAREDSLIGGMALIVDMTRPADARAAMTTTLVHIPRSLVRRVLEEYPDIAARLHYQIDEAMSRYLADLNRAEITRSG